MFVIAYDIKRKTSLRGKLQTNIWMQTQFGLKIGIHKLYLGGRERGWGTSKYLGLGLHGIWLFRWSKQR